MKKILTILTIACVAFVFTGCQKDVPNKFIVELRSVGKEIPNPNITPERCIPEGAEATLESIRYIPGHPIYYMDYTANVDWGSLLTDNNLPLYGMYYLTSKVTNALFNYIPGPTNTDKIQGNACSGFICYNKKGELLNCRNYDGDYGEMVVVFNRNVKPGEHKSVMMTDLNAAQKYSGTGGYNGDNVLLRGGIDLNVLLRQPISTVDGMNDAGLVITSYQLPNFNDRNNPTIDPFPNVTPRPFAVDQNTGKPRIGFSGLHILALTKCATVQDVIDLFRSYDFTTLGRDLNVHWCVSDANNNWKTLEYWVGSDGRDSLYVFDENARAHSANLSSHNVGYEYLSMENYYYNPIPAATWSMDFWQRDFGGVVRAQNMMDHYSPIMDEVAALFCLQYGNFGIEVPGQVTNWSCVYNAKQRTILFNARNDMSQAYTIDLKKDL
ncbi:MAG: linear amide C-N hydrolase [Bacteroidales bacterium]|nr:linear amide C-N hydrolase [Bacteroidales bacterium]